METYPIFISGETTDLCVPCERAISDGWAQWFNDQRVTRWLDHGVFPNSEADQRKFLDAALRKERFVLMICNKGATTLCGVISLSALKPHSAQISLVVPVKGERHMALEAMALVTEHAFNVMGLERVWAGQAYPGLAAWNAKLELIGYRTEGLQRNAFVKGRTVSDVANISCTLSDYRGLTALRGRLWPGSEMIDKLIEARPKMAFAERLKAFLDYEQDYYFNHLIALERHIANGDPAPPTELQRAQMLLFREF